MALGRGKRGRARNNATVNRSRQSARQGTRQHPRRSNDGVPDVFQSMLEEVEPSPTASISTGEDRPLKRRRVTRGIGASSPGSTEVEHSENDSHAQQPPSPSSVPHDRVRSATAKRREPVQTILEDTDESDDTDLEWEDVDIYHSELIGSDHENTSEVKDITIVFDGKEKASETRKRAPRKGITAADRKKRLDIHKLHFLCLLYHVHLRNAWCNDRKVQETLKQRMPPKIVTQLLPDPDYPQLRVAQSISDGLKAVKEFWRENFKVNSQGVIHPRWISSENHKAYKLPENSDPPMSREDFRFVAMSLNGSQDVGAQLFCAMLRSIGVETRLVCSLQCLPFTAVVAPADPPKSEKKTVYLDSATNSITETKDNSPASELSNATPNLVPPKRISRLGRSGAAPSSAFDKGKAPKITAVSHVKPIIKPQYPVFWVEVFNAAHQKWVAVDPLATSTVDNPTKLEPPQSSPLNSLTYAIAFEEDATARDVTRRYAKAYNAKTRKNRVENTEGGTKWLRRSLRAFRRQRILDRDQLEDAALARQEAAEGLPKNIQDFKDHPIYLLERHLKRNEVLHPRHEVGRVTVGSTASKKTETVYRRKDVHVVRSADKWYRLGREVKAGEQPLKHHVRRNPRGRSIEGAGDSDDEAATSVGLYAAFQTELYTPPPVVRGRIPKNAYGNLDVYVPSMVPNGGKHIQHADASKAARILMIDHADAVTGFSFKGRIGTAVVQGCIVAAEYQEAVEAVLDGMAYRQEEEELSMRVAEALRLWRRFFTGLKIVERVQGYASEDEEINVQAELDKEEIEQAVQDALEARKTDEDEGGGFLLDGAMDIEEPRYNFPPTRGNFRFPEQAGSVPQAQSLDEDEEGGGFIQDEPDGGGFLHEDMRVTESLPILPSIDPSAPLNDHYNEYGGGFNDEEVDSSLADPNRSSDARETTNIHAENVKDAHMDVMMSGALEPQITGHESVDEYPSTTTTLEAADGIGPKRSPPQRDQVLSLQTTQEEISSRDRSLEGASESLLPSGGKTEESDSEEGSLLSHDPEDEDAEPEWL